MSSTVTMGPLAPDGGIKLAGVSKSFKTPSGTVHALKDVNLEIANGEFVTLFGPSGCGKSTVLRLIAGLEEQTEGDVNVLGSTAKDASKRKNIAWIPQSSALLPWLDVQRNAEISDVLNKAADRDATTSRTPLSALNLLGDLGLSGFVKSKPKALSGGMRQRASIARGFAQGAPLMLMDEPFSALDELTKDALQVRLLEVWAQHRKTIVFVTHSVNEAVMLSDRVVVMTPRPGRIQGIVHIDLPREDRASLVETPEFVAKANEIKEILRQGWKAEDA